MLNPAARNYYLNEHMDSYTWLKNAPEHEIRQAVMEFRPTPQFTTTPFRHQLVCFYLGLSFPTFGFFLKMRLGKSKIILDMHTQRARMRAPDPFRTLVLVPQLIHFEAWLAQAAQHAPHLTIRALDGSSRVRWSELMHPTADIYILNYTGLTWLLVPHDRKQKKPPRINTEAAADLGRQFHMLICDESTAIKNSRSQAFQAVNALATHIELRYCLTGTPFGRHPEDLWSQLYILDRGKALGRTIWFFRDVFCSKHKTPWTTEYKFLEKYTSVLTAKLGSRSITYQTDECFDMPKTMYVPVYVKWETEGECLYTKIHDSYVESGKESAKQASEREHHFIKLRQITAGFLRYESPQTGQPVEYIFHHNPKLDAVLELLHGIAEDTKCVIFHFFIKSGELLAQACEKEQITCQRIWSGTADKRTALRAFQEDPHPRVLIINESIGSMALDLQIADYLIFYESPVAPIVREQAEARCLGPSRKKTVFIHDIIMRSSIDERVLEYVKEGKNLQHEILQGKAAL